MTTTLKRETFLTYINNTNHATVHFVILCVKNKFIEINDCEVSIFKTEKCYKLLFNFF